MADDELTHARARRLLSVAWDNELTATEKVALSRHLAYCQLCRRRARKMWTFLAGIEDLLKQRGTMFVKGIGNLTVFRFNQDLRRAFFQ